MNKIKDVAEKFQKKLAKLELDPMQSGQDPNINNIVNNIQKLQAQVNYLTDAVKYLSKGKIE
jgi:hypothetical protein